MKKLILLFALLFGAGFYNQLTRAIRTESDFKLAKVETLRREHESAGLAQIEYRAFWLQLPMAKKVQILNFLT